MQPGELLNLPCNGGYGFSDGKKKSPEKNRDSVLCGDLDRIQTYNLLIRSQMLYSIELRSQFFGRQR